MYCDSRLANAAANFCLCSSCSKSDITEGVICPIHEKFMKLTQELELAAPVFACPYFDELKGGTDYLSVFCDTDNKVSLDRMKDQWEAQKMIWAKENV